MPNTNPLCSLCGSPSHKNRVLSSGKQQYRCSNKETCGKTFTPESGGNGAMGRPKKYDSNATRQAAYRTRNQKTGNEARNKRKKPTE